MTFHVVFQNAAAATGNGTALDCGGLSVVGVQISGTFSGTVTFEGSMDGTTWAAVLSRKVVDGTSVTTATAPGLYQAPVAGLTQFRVRVSAYTSGNITAKGLGVYVPAWPLT